MSPPVDPRVEALVRALLHEGYLLYPYHGDAPKNRRRWTFGALFPPSWTEAHRTGDAPALRAEVLVEGAAAETVTIRARFLHVAEVQVPGEAPWQEAAEREVVVGPLPLDGPPCARAFALEASLVSDGEVVRRHARVDGRVNVATTTLAPGLVRVRVDVENVTALEQPERLDRDAAAAFALASTHVLLTAAGGARFVSLADPPPALAAAAAACVNQGVWPALVGPPGARDTVVASPIIVSDHPALAPESPGDLFDATEIDELLSLRVRTLTDEEKEKVRRGDPRGRALLERAEGLDEAALGRLHGAERSAGTLARAGLRRGDRVRVAPRARADALDVVLRGLLAQVESVEVDLEGRVHVAVVLDDDPGRDLGLAGQPGHRFFFDPRDLEPLDGGAA